MTPIYFDYVWLLPLALVLPLLALWLLSRAYRRRRARLERLGQLDLVSRLVPAAALTPPRWRSARLGLAAALVGIAIAGPRWGEERNVVRSSGIDMVLALDASLSMRAQDVRPDRLERMKQEVRRLRAISGGDRVGLIAFAGRSYILTPLTVDEGALDLYLDNLDPSVVGQAGSSLARAIRQATDLLMLSKSSGDKAIVVMSDGEAFEPVEDVVTEAKRAGEQGISLVTVGFGTPEGATIPVSNPDGSAGQKRDEQGQVVITRYSPTMLQAAAQAAGGTFIPAEATDKADRIKRALAALRTAARTTVGGETKTPRFQWFLLPAVLLLVLDSFLAERRGRRLRRAAAAEPASAVAAVVLLALFLGACASGDTVREAAAAYDAHQYARAASLYAHAVADGDRRPQTLYNYGTALIANDSLERAAEVLERAAESKDAELHYRALFNLGLAHLKRGLAAPAGTETQELDAALDAYKKVLLLRWQDLDAKWNYELALRKKQSGGGGGGGGGAGGSAQNQSPQSEKPQPAGGLGQRQADQLLGSAAREERDVQAKKQQQNKVEPPPGGKDW